MFLVNLAKKKEKKKRNKPYWKLMGNNIRRYYSIPDPSPWNCAIHSQGDSSFLCLKLWKCPTVSVG